MGSRSEAVQGLRSSIDWGRLAPLRLRARSIADGVYAGAHRSTRRGPGVEFGGHRPYVPGDDLRWIDRDGNEQTEEFTGLWATSVQHQIDHLDGRMYFDRLSRVKRDMLIKRARKGRA